MGTPPKVPLPFMETMQDALALCQRENDNFYLTAFVIQAWLGDVTLQTAAQYAEQKRAKNRKLQQGLAAKSFSKMFAHASDEEFHHILSALGSFASFDGDQSQTISQAFEYIAQEFPQATCPDPTLPRNADQLTAVNEFVHTVVNRLCEWVEAVIHVQTHWSSHRIPLAFDPDPEKRELAILGVQQRYFPGMNDSQKAWWQWHHSEAAESISDPAKWSLVGKAMVDTTTTHQSYPALDECIIMCWPLVLRHQWTYRDLMNVIQSLAPVALSYPCGREQDLASYCNNVLGLRKKSRGKTDPNGTPAGYEVVRAMCTPGPSSGLS